MLNDATGLKKIYLAAGYTDLRRGIDGLATMIRFRFRLDPYDKNTLFLFCGKRTNRIKGLPWEGDGFLLLYKRLDNGAFSWPRSAEEALEISSEQYAMLMQGLGDHTEASNPAKRQSQETDVVFVHYREKNFRQKSGIFILLHLSTASGSQTSSSMIFQRKSIPDLWIAVQNIWNFMEISQVFCIVIHRHNDERETAARWQKQRKSGTMDS